MSNYSDNNDFNSILKRLLDRVDDRLDKREGSIIYDALAPAASELAQCYIALDIYSSQTYLLDAVGENLDNRVAEIGLERIPATNAIGIIHTYNSNDELMAVPIGSRFSVPNDFGGYIFKVTEQQAVGVYKSECETAGKVGNSYTGELLPLQSINNLGTVILNSIETSGRDIETDDNLRERALLKINQEAFAGNKASYREIAIECGAEDCKVYPVWDGGGTVKLAVVGPDHTLLGDSEVARIQNEIDPNPQGTGIGIAPIGHTVTVVTPTADNLAIVATLELQTGADIEQVRPAVIEQIQNYIYDVQNDFVDTDRLLIYLSKISAAILNVKEVRNVSSLTINGQAQDYEINNSGGITVKYPILPENGVTLNVAT